MRESHFKLFVAGFSLPLSPLGSAPHLRPILLHPSHLAQRGSELARVQRRCLLVSRPMLCLASKCLVELEGLQPGDRAGDSSKKVPVPTSR